MQFTFCCLFSLCFNLLCYRGWEELQGDDNDRLGWQDSPSWDLFRFKHVLQLLNMIKTRNLGTVSCCVMITKSVATCKPLNGSEISKA